MLQQPCMHDVGFFMCVCGGGGEEGENQLHEEQAFTSYTLRAKGALNCLNLAALD